MALATSCCATAPRPSESDELLSLKSCCVSKTCCSDAACPGPSELNNSRLKITVEKLETDEPPGLPPPRLVSVLSRADGPNSASSWLRIAENWFSVGVGFGAVALGALTATVAVGSTRGARRLIGVMAM